MPFLAYCDYDADYMETTVEGYLNQSTPFAAAEHNVVWKSERRYHDFTPNNHELATCNYPRFWNDAGHQVTDLSDRLVGCRDSDFDQVFTLFSAGLIVQSCRTD